MNVELFIDTDGKTRYKLELRVWSILEPSDDPKEQLSRRKTIEAKFRYLFNVLKQHRIISNEDELNFVPKEYTPDEIETMMKDEIRIN